MNKKGTIYLLSHPEAGKYIGQTTSSVSNKIQVMRTESKNDTKRPILQAFREYGVFYIRKSMNASQWELTILHEEVDIEDLNRVQIEEIDKQAANLNYDRGWRKGKIRGETRKESREKMAEAKEGTTLPPNTIKKISRSRSGRKHSKSTRAKMSKSQRLRHLKSGNKVHGNAGRKHSEETRAKMRDARKRQQIAHSDETRKKISESLRGRKHSAAARRKMRAAHRKSQRR